MDQETVIKTRWHQLLGKLLEEWLTPVGITVQTDVPVTSEPTKADILLLRNPAKHWNAAQKARLPDGIRHSKAAYILIEFKYSESVNKEAFLQTLSYDTLYRRTQNLSGQELQSFIVSSKTARRETMENFGYTQTVHSGVYQSENPLLKDVQLILLNELTPDSCNAPIKCFASQKVEQRKAFTTIIQNLKGLPPGVERFLYGLQKLLFIAKGVTMSGAAGLTADYVMQVGKEAIEQILSSLPPEEVLKNYKPEERLIGLRPEERLQGLRSEDVLKNYKPEERLQGLRSEDVLKNYRAEERLQGLEPEEIQRYLDSLKK